MGDDYGLLYTQILMVLQYVIPSLVLLFTYTSIATVIWCHRIPGEAENSRDQRIARSKRKVSDPLLLFPQRLRNIAPCAVIHLMSSLYSLANVALVLVRAQERSSWEVIGLFREQIWLHDLN